MRKSIFVVLLPLFLLSCGGGGNSILPPGGHDLSGLEGIWDISCAFQGSVSGPGGTFPISEDFSGFCTITRTSVKNDNGEVITSSYNGTTLTLVDVVNVGGWDPTCGNIDVSGTFTFIIPIVPGGTNSNISGSGSMTGGSENCEGTVTGTIQVAGDFIKR
jgi:hypothetical protein